MMGLIVLCHYLGIMEGKKLTGDGVTSAREVGLCSHGSTCCGKLEDVFGIHQCDDAHELPMGCGTVGEASIGDVRIGC